MKGETSFLKDELSRIDAQIGHHSYGGNIAKIKQVAKLWEIRKGIVNEIGKETKEINFLTSELSRIDIQIKAYKYEAVNLDKVIELFELRKIILEEIKIIEEKGPQIRRI